MSPLPAVLAAWILAQLAAPAATPNATPVATPDASAPPASQTVPELADDNREEPTQAPAAPPVEPRLYGYAGMSEISLALGYSSVSGFLAGGAYRRFVLPGLAPGLEATVQTGKGTTFAFLLADLRVLPVRTRTFALVVTGRAGRVLVSHHDDGWGAGGGAGVIVFFGSNLGLEISYDVLWLLPGSFCADFSTCVIQGPALGLRLAF
jgi:hypothetical protein